MERYVLILSLITATGLGVPGLAAQERTPVVLENRTGQNLVELYIIESGRPSTDSLGEDWLKTQGQPQWEDGRQLALVPPFSPPWEIIGVRETGEEIRWPGICPGPRTLVSLRLFGEVPQTVYQDY